MAYHKDNQDVNRHQMAPASKLSHSAQLSAHSKHTPGSCQVEKMSTHKRFATGFKCFTTPPSDRYLLAHTIPGDIPTSCSWNQEPSSAL